MSAWDDEMSVDDGVVMQRNWDKDYQWYAVVEREREREEDHNLIERDKSSRRAASISTTNQYELEMIDIHGPLHQHEPKI